MATKHAPTVLIVEDEALIALDLETIAQEAGYSTVVVSDYPQAMAALVSNKIDFALLDGEVGGVEMAHLLRSRSVPFGFCTGAPLSSIPIELQNAPFFGKPFRSEEILAALVAARPQQESAPAAGVTET